MEDFEMRNFHHFPMEKTSYDLKLELLEELGPDEAMELMKANKGFRSIYLGDPWRIFGRHIQALFFHEYDIEVRKMRHSTSFPCDPRFHLPLLKKIKSCVEFRYLPKANSTGEVRDAARKMLTNLDVIKEWEYSILDLWSFKDCFSRFKGQITDYIYLCLYWYSGEENDPTLSRITKIFESQLGNCKEVLVDCRVDQFSIIYKLFSNTKIQKIGCDFDTRLSMTRLKRAIRWIVCNGIPSQNQEAEISINPSQFRLNPDRIPIVYRALVNYLSVFPGMQQLPDDDDRHNYRRKIDDERDCVYQLRRKCPYIFSAKYVPSQAQ